MARQKVEEELGSGVVRSDQVLEDLPIDTNLDDEERRAIELPVEENDFNAQTV